MNSEEHSKVKSDKRAAGKVESEAPATRLDLKGTLDDRHKEVVFTSEAKGGKLAKSVKVRVGGHIVADTAAGLEVRVPMSALVALDDFKLVSDGGAEIPLHAHGPFFDAVQLDTPKVFYERIQMAGTRIKSQLGIRLGAISAYRLFEDQTTKIAALTVYGHRIVEGLMTEPGQADTREIARFVEWAMVAVERGRAGLEAEKVAWDLVRWTLSLATVAGNICIAVDRLEDARTLFGVCVRFRDKVALSRVSSLNIINGALIHGGLCMIAGNREEAEASFRACVDSYKPCVEAQNLFENVWVIGDLMNSARAVRMAFIAIMKFGFDPRKPEAVLDPGSFYDITAIQSPIGRLINAGFCRRWKSAVDTLNGVPAA